MDASAVEGTVKPSQISQFSRRICDRHEGVGADGVEWMYPHLSADVEIRLINADGSEAEISGNGTRCVAAYLCAEHAKDSITILTGAGMKTCSLLGSDKFEYEFEVEMGEAVVEGELVLQTAAGEVRGIPVSMGNPHYVVFVPVFSGGWQEEAERIRASPPFNHGVNVEMVVVDGMHDVSVRFFERGVGDTRSSGTGSCASAAAAIAAGKAQSPIRVHAPGGTQTVRTEGKRVFLRGPARLVCRGEFFLS